MAVEGGMKCVQFLLFVFNFIFWLCGLVLIVVGVLVQIGLHNTLAIHDASASAGPIVIIGIGVVIFFVAFFGCCGAWKENYCMVTTFAILLFLIIVVEIAAVIAGYMFREKLSNVVEDSLTEMISGYKNSTADFKKTVDKLQEDMKCCGGNSSADWRSFGKDGKSVPDSCCVKPSANCGQGTMKNHDKVYQKGCHDALLAFLRKKPPVGDRCSSRHCRPAGVWHRVLLPVDERHQQRLRSHVIQPHS